MKIKPYKHTLVDGRFQEPYQSHIPSMKEFFKWGRTLKRAKGLSYITTKQFNLQEGELVWLGHASFMMKLNNKVFCFDPCFFNLPFIKRWTNLPALPKVDYVFYSHGHRDHYDRKSLKYIKKQNPNVNVYGPLKFSNICKGAVELEWWEQQDINNVKITFLPAKHWHKRGLFDLNKILWGSYWIQYKNTTVYFAGDTAYDAHFKEIVEQLGYPNIAILPIGAYAPRWMMKESHMNPEEVKKAIDILQPQKVIPLHYGTFVLSAEPFDEPIKVLKKMTSKVVSLVVGESFKI